MDILQFIVSINKFGLLVFIATVGFIVYELHLLLKERAKKNKPMIPQFNPGAAAGLAGQKTVVVQQKPALIEKKSSHGILVLILLIALPIVGGIVIYGKSVLSTGMTTTQSPAVEVQEVQSQGIKIFDKNWKELKSYELADLQQGDAVLCAVETIPGVAIDRARIRINESSWALDHITTQFNKNYNVFYKDCIVATGSAQLKIEAQLHSSADGWLGE